MQEYVGMPLNEALDKIKDLGLKYRILRADKENIITADFHPERLNLYVDEKNVISAVEGG